METRLDRTGVDATANNIIRTARATARFFPQTAPRRFEFFSVRYHRSGMRGGMRVIPPKLMMHTVTQPNAFLLQLFGEA